MTTLHGINYIEALTWRERLELFLCFPAFVVVSFADLSARNTSNKVQMRYNARAVKKRCMLEKRLSAPDGVVPAVNACGGGMVKKRRADAAS